MDNKSPKVTVIIPNYNHAQYLPQRIESVLRQDFTDFEVLLLDDCSPDNSREVIGQYTEIGSRIKNIFNERNSGSVFKQWHKGLSLAKGDYIWIAESDDFAEPNFLSTLVPLLENDVTLAFAYSNSLIVDESSQPIEEISEIKRRIFDSEHWHRDFIADGKQELRQYLSLQCTVNNASAVLFRRSSIEAAGGVDTSFRYAGDWLMYIKLSLQGRIAYRADCLNNYREHGTNASKSSFKDGSQMFERQKCFAFVYQSGALDDNSREIMLQQASGEYHELSYLVAKTLNQPIRAVKMIVEIFKISPAYYLRIQRNSIGRMRIFNRSIN